jgi:hypothetical protein
MEAAFGAVEISVFGDKSRRVGGNVLGVKVVGRRKGGVTVLRGFSAAIVQLYFQP